MTCWNQLICVNYSLNGCVLTAATDNILFEFNAVQQLSNLHILLWL